MLQLFVVQWSFFWFMTLWGKTIGLIGLIHDRLFSCAWHRGLCDHGIWKSLCRSMAGTVFSEVLEKPYWVVQSLAATSFSSSAASCRMMRHAVPFSYCPLSSTWTMPTVFPLNTSSQILLQQQCIPALATLRVFVLVPTPISMQNAHAQRDLATRQGQLKTTYQF